MRGHSCVSSARAPSGLQLCSDTLPINFAFAIFRFLSSSFPQVVRAPSPRFAREARCKCSAHSVLRVSAVHGPPFRLGVQLARLMAQGVSTLSTITPVEACFNAQFPSAARLRALYPIGLARFLFRSCGGGGLRIESYPHTGNGIDGAFGNTMHLIRCETHAPTPRARHPPSGWIRWVRLVRADGQGSGHDFYGTLYTPSIGWRNNTDGGRSVLFPDYRQA